jgi:hypothetical protein
MHHSHDCRTVLSDRSGSLIDFARGTLRCDLDLINGTTLATVGHKEDDFSTKLRTVMSSIMRRRSGLMGFSLIGVLLS